MTTPRDPIGEIDLQAYVDDLLDPRRRAEVEALLAADPETATRIADFRAQRTAIRRLYDPVLDEPVPERLRAMLHRPARRIGPMLLRLAAAVALTLAAGYGGWWMRGDGPGPVPAVRALLTQASLGQPSAGWVETAVIDAKDAGTLPVPAPDLSRYGYQLVGRSSSDAAVPVERLDYEGPAGPLSLFLGTMPQGSTPPQPFAGRHGAGLYWIDDQRIHALTGPAKDLPVLAEAIRRQTAVPSASIEARAGRADPTDETVQPPGPALEMLPMPEADAAVGQL